MANQLSPPFGTPIIATHYCDPGIYDRMHTYLQRIHMYSLIYITKLF